MIHVICTTYVRRIQGLDVQTQWIARAMVPGRISYLVDCWAVIADSFASLRMAALSRYNPTSSDGRSVLQPAICSGDLPQDAQLVSNGHKPEWPAKNTHPED